MSRGRRYNNKPKLNIKKVIAVIVAIIVIIMFIIAVKNLLKSDSSSNNLVSTTYFLINKDNKWGVIDNNSKIIIEPVYNDAIIIPNNKKDIFICTYDVDYENDTYKTKVLNSKGKELFTSYEKVNALENYDKDNNLWYEDNVLLVQKDGKYGLINFEGKEILDISFDDIHTLKGIKNSLITVKEKKLGVVNNLGKKIIDNKYEDIKSLGDNTKLYIVKENNKYGIYGITENKYEDIKQLDNKEIYCVKEDNNYKVINKEGNIVFKEKFNEIETIKNDVIVYKNDNGYSAYNIKSNKKLEKSYKQLKYTSNNMFIFKQNNNYGIIDLDNNIKIKDEYTNINYYEDVNIYELEEKGKEENSILNSDLTEIAKGIVNKIGTEKTYIKIWTTQGYKYIDSNGESKTENEVLSRNNLFVSKKDNKYGLVDKEGNVVVEYIYDDITEQNEFGYIGVKKDGLWGSLDKQGHEICEPKYNLDDNLIIDFIGQYHLGKDINLMYYTEK